MSNIKLEVGKKYRTKDGKLVTVIAEFPETLGESFVCIVGSDPYTRNYRANGVYARDYTSWDIVEEVREPIKVKGWIVIPQDRRQWQMHTLYRKFEDAKEHLGPEETLVEVSGVSDA